MRLVSWNVNGLRSIVTKGLNEFLAGVSPDCLCIQETKAQKSQLSDEHMSPCSMISEFFDSEKKGYSGVATYVHSRFGNHEVYSYGIGNELIDREGRVLISKLRCNSEELYIANCYFPSGTTGEERQNFKYFFLDVFYDFINQLPQHVRQRMIICGDLNICHQEIDIHHPKEAERRELSGFLPKEREWIDRLVNLGFVDTFRHCNGTARDQYTWWTFRAGARQKNKGWRIDYIFAAKELSEAIQSATILPKVLGSDHCPIVLDIN